jgi:hypothetical protein
MTTFVRSYTDAFATFGASVRRPRLVMDAFDIAAKSGRLNNARSTQLILVNAMRYDLGTLVRDQMLQRLCGKASLTAEFILWSALPTTTYRQLETLARGLDALRAPGPEEPAETLRGRSAEIVRRLRVGSRELHKLDLVPAQLGAIVSADARGTGSKRVVDSLGTIADQVAATLADYIAALPPRTLVLVFGDHGFTIDRHGGISNGTATPEEVLMPCFCWVTGDLH